MHPQRRNRLIAVAVLVAGVGLTITLVLTALEENIDLFYEPAKVVAGEAPVGARIRVGGMVLDDSVERDPNSLQVAFMLSDMQGNDFTVRYEGILPDLFREGQGIVATGRLGSDGVFEASQVLAKHDENYMPPELAGMAEAAEAANDGAAYAAGEGTGGS